MKNIFKLLSVTVLLIAGSGCDEFLDREPLSDLSPDTFFADKSDMRSWTAGIYDAFQATLDREHLEWGDVRSDNYHTTGYEDSKVYMNAIESTTSDWSWSNLYETVTRCNVAIERFPNIPNTVKDDWGDYLGQAYGMRAYMYFYAIRVWGDVPLITESWDGNVENSYVPRTSVDLVKAQILSDIDNAILYLSSDVASGRKYYFNLAAAYALKMDVHMWFHEYDEALEAYDDYFAGNSNFQLVEDAADWKDIFLNPTASKETIFNMFWDPLLDDGHPWAQRVGANNTNNPYKISENLFYEFVARLRSGQGADGRLWNVLDTVKLWNSGNKLPISTSHWTVDGINKNVKYSGLSQTATSQWMVFSSEDADIKVSLYRYADVLLLRAEALNQTGHPAEALEIVNDIRSRVGYLADAADEVTNLNDKDEIEDIILLERQLEFLAEGKRWFDLVRTGKVIEVMDPVLRARQEAAQVEITGFGHEGRILFPIYYREFESNPSLKGHQNPPYTEG